MTSSEEQQKALVNLWAEKYDELDSKDNRKVWDDIAQKLNTKFKLKRATDKYKQKTGTAINLVVTGENRHSMMLSIKQFTYLNIGGSEI